MNQNVSARWAEFPKLSRNLKEIGLKMEGNRLLKALLLVSVAILLFATDEWGAQKPAEQPSQPSEATVYDYTRRPAFPNFLSSYTSPYVPTPSLANSELLKQLRSGNK